MKLIFTQAIFLLLLICCQPVFAQLVCEEVLYSTDEKEKIAEGSNFITINHQQFIIKNILIAGNKKTNPDIILRELSFDINEAYSIEAISKKFLMAKKQLMNTGLFQSVVVSLRSVYGNEVWVDVIVKERWYIWPKPFIKPVDKNFEQWRQEGNKDMSRINYGISLTHKNFTGRNDKLFVNIMNGYTKQLSVQYYGLFLDHHLKFSINGGFSIGRNREVNYMTVDNKTVAVKNNNYLRSYISWFTELNYRPAIKTKHTVGIGYSYEEIADTISKLNPLFSDNRNIIRLPEASYKITYFDVDFIPYPTKGYLAEASIKKKGFNDPINLWQLTAKGSGTWPINPKYFFTLSAVGMLKLPFSQPYITNQFIGSDKQFLQGYENYIIDGVAGGYTKATITRQIVNTHFRTSSKKLERLNQIPLKVFAKTFVNAGYIYSQHAGQNALNNKIVYSGGVGLDIVVFTDFVIKIEWSFNRLGENGLYLHRRNYF